MQVLHSQLYGAILTHEDLWSNQESSLYMRHSCQESSFHSYQVVFLWVVHLASLFHRVRLCPVWSSFSFSWRSHSLSSLWSSKATEPWTLVDCIAPRLLQLLKNRRILCDRINRFLTILIRIMSLDALVRSSSGPDRSGRSICFRQLIWREKFRPFFQILSLGQMVKYGEFLQILIIFCLSNPKISIIKL